MRTRRVTASIAGIMLTAVAAACTAQAVRSAAPASAPAGPMNILLMGLDDRPDLPGSRTDTLVVVHVPALHDRVQLVSIPRDAWVEVAGGGPRKINQVAELAGSGQAGYRALVDTVAQLAGIHINHYAAVQMPAFAELSDRIGGVSVCLCTASKDPFADADFLAGQQVVRGESALAFVRQRHQLPGGDLDRVVRQQVFLRGMLDKLSEPDHRNAVLSAAETALILDEGWDLADFAVQVNDLAGVPVETRTIPVTVDSSPNLKVDPLAVRELFAGLDASPTRQSGPDAPSTGKASEPPCVS